MDRAPPQTGAGAEADWPYRRNPLRVTPDELVRAARALVAAYGPRAVELMEKRTRAVRRRGDGESAALWIAVARAVEKQLSSVGALSRKAS